MGLNLKNPESEAIIIAVNKKFSENYQYSYLAAGAGRPDQPMPLPEIYYMFYLSLVGVTEQRPDGSSVTFPGALHDLVTHLAMRGLDTKPFEAHQLVSLLSMTFNSPATIGEHLLEALAHLEQDGSMNALIEIIERTNKENTAGVAIRRLMEGAVFEADPDQVHLSYRAAEAVLAHDPRPLHGRNVYALPKGRVELDFIGDATVHTVPGTDDPQDYDSETYGTVSADTVSVDGNDSKVVATGEGDDLLTVTTASVPGTAGAHYLAGGRGFDRYQVAAKGAGQVMVVDADHSGELVDGQGRHLVGLAVGKPSESSYSLQGSTLTLVRDSATGAAKASAAASEESLTLRVIQDGGTSTTMVPDYTLGQFGILYTEGRQQLDVKFPSDYQIILGEEGHWIRVYAQFGLVLLELFDADNHLVKQVKTQTFPDDKLKPQVVIGRDHTLCVIYPVALPNGGEISYQLFDDRLTPLSGVTPFPLARGDMQIVISGGIGAQGTEAGHYLFALGCRHRTNEGNFYPATAVAVDALQFLVINTQGSVVHAPEIVAQHAPGPDSYSASFAASQEGGTWLLINESGTPTQGTVLQLSADYQVLDTLKLPAGAGRAAPTREGFMVVVNTSPEKKLALYKNGQGLQTLPLPLAVMGELSSLLAPLTPDTVFIVSMGKKTEGAVINTQGEALLQHLDLGEGMALHLQLQSLGAGKVGVFSSTGLLSVKRWRMDIAGPGFRLVPGQQQVALTAPEAEEYCQTRASNNQTNMRCVLPGMLPDGVSLQVEIRAPLSTAVAALPDQILTACASPSQEPHAEQLHCDSGDGSIQLNAATLIQGMHALPGHLMLGMVAGFTVRQLFWCFQNWSAGRGFMAKEPPLSEAKVKAVLGTLHVRMEQLLEDLEALLTKYGAKSIHDDTGVLDRIEHLAERLDQLTAQEKIYGSELRPLEAALDNVDYQLRHLRLSPLSAEEVATRSSTLRSTATSSPTSLFREVPAMLPSATAIAALAPAQPEPALGR